MPFYIRMKILFKLNQEGEFIASYPTDPLFIFNHTYLFLTIVFLLIVKIKLNKSMNR